MGRMLTPTHLADLLVDPAAHPRGQPHISAASGLVLAGRQLYLVADDEHHLGHLALRQGQPPSPLDLVRIAPGDLPVDKAARKRRKPDLEALVLLPAQPAWPQGALLALGSGSTPQRERGFLVPLDARQLPAAAARAVDLAPLYRPLQQAFGALNLEAAFVQGERLCLLQRANKGVRINACVSFALDGVLRWLAGSGDGPTPTAVQSYELGDAGGVPLGFTDATAAPDGGWLFSAAAEDTQDSYADGACAGSALGWVGADGVLSRVEALAGAPKVEGIALADANRLLIVTDADDPKRASQLLTLQL